MNKDRRIGGSLILALTVLVGIGLWRTSGQPAPQRTAVIRRCRAVMGTDCSLAVVVRPGDQARADVLFDEAEAVLRATEARMSSWLADSEIGQLAAAEAGQPTRLSPDTLAVLRLAREAQGQTEGVFDVTCRPLVELWREAGRRGVAPSRAELADARAASNWDLIGLTDAGAIKRRGTARVDLGGIAKGWAIDRAVDVLRGAGIDGGLVDVGGDLICFGQPPTGDTWPVDVKDPLGPGRLIRLNLPGGAVCTSGGYARFVEIDGRRHSHIVDPRTGQTADAILSATVVATDAVTADVWATALSVLGPDGLRLLPEGVEAMLVVDAKDAPEAISTPGFRRLLEKKGSELFLGQ